MAGNYNNNNNNWRGGGGGQMAISRHNNRGGGSFGGGGGGRRPNRNGRGGPRGHYANDYGGVRKNANKNSRRGGRGGRGGRGHRQANNPRAEVARFADANLVTPRGEHEPASMALAAQDRDRFEQLERNQQVDQYQVFDTYAGRTALVNNDQRNIHSGVDHAFRLMGAERMNVFMERAFTPGVIAGRNGEREAPNSFNRLQSLLRGTEQGMMFDRDHEAEEQEENVVATRTMLDAGHTFNEGHDHENGSTSMNAAEAVNNAADEDMKDNDEDDLEIWADGN